MRGTYKEEVNDLVGCCRGLHGSMASLTLLPATFCNTQLDHTLLFGTPVRPSADPAPLSRFFIRGLKISSHSLNLLLFQRNHISIYRLIVEQGLIGTNDQCVKVVITPLGLARPFSR